ncbi:hypothetical protein [Rhizobium lentis]|uniref:hypothetical protein n=1 Tax=Rhizobium lentis TaxID=1138194 RepID=UPI001C830632|nr:hypothetical protein [Rhizobium lentis]MBX5015947.1 hypothetical protein [Rhizobium lentis]
MQVRNLETGEVESMRHGPATDAVNAGTHEFVSLDEKGEVKEGAKKKTAKSTKAAE